MAFLDQHLRKSQNSEHTAANVAFLPTIFLNLCERCGLREGCLRKPRIEGSVGLGVDWKPKWCQHSDREEKTTLFLVNINGKL